MIYFCRRYAQSSAFWNLKLFIQRQGSRKILALIISLSFLGSLLVYVWLSSAFSTAGLFKSLRRQRLPPLYPEQRKFEWLLPQHDLSLPPPEGQHGRYLYIANHVRGRFSVVGKCAKKKNLCSVT